MQIVSKKFYICLTAIPSVALGVYLVFAIKAYMTVGLFPQVNNPDPRTVGLFTYGLFIIIGLLASLVSSVPWIGVTIFSWYKQLFTKKFLLISSIVYVVSLVFLFSLIRLDYGGFWWWLNAD